MDLIENMDNGQTCRALARTVLAISGRPASASILTYFTFLKGQCLLDEDTDRLHPEEVIAGVPQSPLLHHAPCFCHISSSNLFLQMDVIFLLKGWRTHFKICQQNPQWNGVLAGLGCLGICRTSILDLIQTHLKMQNFMKSVFFSPVPFLPATVLSSSRACPSLET